MTTGMAKKCEEAPVRIEGWMPLYRGDKQKLRETCYHECCHSIIGHARGLDTERLGVWAVASSTALHGRGLVTDIVGECFFIRPSGMYTDEHWNAKLLALLAGGAGSRMHSGRAGQGGKFGSDERLALATAALIVGDEDASAYVETKRVEATALVFTHRADISALATRLEHERTIHSPFR